MHKNRLDLATHTFMLGAVAALLSACETESPTGPRTRSDARATSAALTEGEGSARRVDLGDCQQLRAAEGSKLAAHLYADGVQIYHWDGTRWIFDGPSAALYANAEFTGQVGTHSAGPEWVHFGGGKVRASMPVSCPVGSTAIPWLLLRAIPDAVAGIFNRVTAIQRVNTTGGVMPADAGTPGEVRRVPYTAEYYFYR